MLLKKQEMKYTIGTETPDPRRVTVLHYGDNGPVTSYIRGYLDEYNGYLEGRVHGYRVIIYADISYNFKGSIQGASIYPGYNHQYLNYFLNDEAIY